MIQLSRPCLGNQELEAVQEVIESNQLAQGSRNSEFEKRLGEYIGRSHALTTSSGTTALKLALQASGIKPGDRILTTPFICRVLNNVILGLGCRPVFCDIEDETFNISPEALDGKNLDDVDGVILVHIFGFPCDIDRILDSCSGKIIIEDFAQALGSEYKGRKTGNFGDASITSFYATKQMTTGEGGALFTDDEETRKRADFLRCNEAYPSSYLLRNPNTRIKEYEDIIPSNHRITDIQAALGIVQLRKLDIFNEKRRAFARYYDEELSGLGIGLPREKKHGKHIYHRYSLLCKSEDQRRKLIRHMIKNKIEVGILYPTPLHLLLPKRFGFREGDFPVAEDVSKRILSIPMHPSLMQKELEKVIEAVKVFFNGSV